LNSGLADAPGLARKAEHDDEHAEEDEGFSLVMIFCPDGMKIPQETARYFFDFHEVRPSLFPTHAKLTCGMRLPGLAV